MILKVWWASWIGGTFSWHMYSYLSPPSGMWVAPALATCFTLVTTALLSVAAVSAIVVVRSVAREQNAGYQTNGSGR